MIDRPTASRLGVTPLSLDNILYDAFGEREVASTFTPMNQYFVVMEVDPEFWQTRRVSMRSMRPQLPAILYRSQPSRIFTAPTPLSP